MKIVLWMIWHNPAAMSSYHRALTPALPKYKSSPTFLHQRQVDKVVEPMSSTRYGLHQAFGTSLEARKCAD